MLTQDDLRRRIDKSRNVAAFVAASVFLFYIINFTFRLGWGVSKDPAVWGQFGDYLGGILNPIIAYLAFYWLTQSIMLQREELQATKDALKESAEAQTKQERHAARTAKINALSALLLSHNNDISTLRGNIEFVLSQRHSGNVIFSPFGGGLGPKAADSLVIEMNTGVESALERRRLAMDEVSALLREGDA